MGIIVALIVFGIIVTVHEFGHFICAKLSGIRVLEFSIGMGLKIIQKQFGETKYSLRALPVGGYCAMEGEDSDTEDARGFRKAKLWKRMTVLAAGPFMNFVLGFLMLIVMVCMMDKVPTNKISGFSGVRNEDGSVTYYASSYDPENGLKHGDIIKKIDGTRVFSMLDINYIFEMKSSGEDGTRSVEIIRDGKKMKFDHIKFHDAYPGGNGDEIDFGLERKSKNPVTVIKGSGDIFMSMSHIIGLSLKQLATGKVEKEEVSGPVGVVSEINEATKEAEDEKETAFTLVYLAALISINVGLFNLLPIPGLDGGRLLFCFIELIRRKPVKPEHEGYVHLVGMIILFGIMIFATYNDIIKIITGHK
ncbi:MAG TPA: site-2 protease family protein [Ruminococcus sp.]|nr:site-2 protease family protein [Ruminococcus sp.]